MFRFCRKIGSVHKKVTNHKGEDKIWLIRDDNGFYLIKKPLDVPCQRSYLPQYLFSGKNPDLSHSFPVFNYSLLQTVVSLESWKQTLLQIDMSQTDIGSLHCTCYNMFRIFRKICAIANNP